MTEQPPKKYILRFTQHQRFEHWLTIIAFLGLILSGLPQKFSDSETMRTLIGWMGGVESLRILHRFFALLLIAEVVFHTIMTGYHLVVLKLPASMRPRKQDWQDFMTTLQYTTGQKKELPRSGRFTYMQKFEYWLIVSGLLTMLITGFMLWNPIAVTNILPGELIPAAQIAHSQEAMIMIAMIFILHLYNALTGSAFFSIFTGNISHKAMQQEHPLELEQLESGERAPITQGGTTFWVISTITALVILGLLYGFMTFEKTATNTVPRQDVQIFAPETIPEEGNAATGQAMWETLRCPNCHGLDGLGGVEGEPALKGYDGLFEEFYEQIRFHGQSGGDMPTFGKEELPDGYLYHLWTWLTQDE